jgi:hypothetical protein
MEFNQRFKMSKLFFQIVCVGVLPVLTTLAQDVEPKKPQPATTPPAARRRSPYDDSILQAMDHGPFYFGSVHGKTTALKGVAVKLGGGTAGVCFDTELMRMSDGWIGGYLQIRGERTTGGHPATSGTNVFATKIGPGWSHDGKLEDPRQSPKEDPRGPKCGPLPRDWAHWKGLYRNGEKTVLNYSVGDADVLELPGLEEKGGLQFLTRTLNIGPSAKDSLLLICEDDQAEAAIAGSEGGHLTGGRAWDHFASLTGASGATTVVGVNGSMTAMLQSNPGGKILLQIPAHKDTARLTVAIFKGPNELVPDFQKAVRAIKPIDLKPLCQGGPREWGEPLKVTGKLGSGTGAYVVDTLTVPEENPFKSWIRCSGLDFFSDGRAAVSSLSGDVWIVSGIDDKLDKLTWQRFATGLYQPLGVKIVNNVVYVTCRDQIVRLHDLNKDGEADFYENFNNDITITDHYHEFCFDLQTDSKGNFYFTKGGNLGQAKLPHHGTLLKLPPDGSTLEIVCAGFREPNGISVGPHDEITVADNEGNWVPSSRVDLIKPGGLYGHMFNYHGATHPNKFDGPLLWLPHSYEIDNSSGGQVWVTSDKWGPIQGDLLHTSYGACLLFHVMQETVDGIPQAAAFKFPLSFDSGIMRGRFNSRDGQLYVCGLNVWQSASKTGLNRRGIFQRVRYTGKPVYMPQTVHVKADRIEVTFTQPLEAKAAVDPQNYSVEEWNYKWTQNYGSPDFKVSEPEVKGHDSMDLKSVTLSPDRKTVSLELADLKPVMQMRIKYNINAADGTALQQEIFETINKVPAKR